jgi:hypothetical protein
MFATYSRLLAAYPLPTKMVTSGTLFSIGDYITQTGNVYLIYSDRKKIKNGLE